MADSMGMADLRAEHIDSIVTGYAMKKYKWKSVCLVKSSSAWIESYYTETSGPLTGHTTEPVRGIPRGSGFPYVEPTWTKSSAYIEKYGGETFIYYEDKLKNNFDVIARCLEKVGEAVANAVDTQIEAAVQAITPNTFALTAGYEWDSATVANRQPIKDLMKAKRYLMDDNYDVDNLYLVVQPQDYEALMGNSQIIQNPSLGEAMINNGVLEKIAGMKVVVSTVGTADSAYVIAGQKAIVWQESVPLTVIQIEDPGIKTTVRAYELGVAQVVHPNAICEITNVRA